MITLKQLSELSGFSIRTVSRILNGQPNVRPEKRERVLQLAAEHHYVPNMAARNLRTQDTRFVGILLDHFTHNAAMAQLNVLNDVLLEKGYSPIVGRLRPGREEECIATLNRWAGMVSHVIVMYLFDPAAEQKLRDAARKLPLRLIFADCATASGEWDVAVDRASAIAGMIRELKQRGCRRILHCGYLPTRLAGMALAARQPWAAGLELSCLEVRGDDGFVIGDEVMRRRPDAVFLDTDRLAVGFYAYAACNGIRIPEDLAVVGFDDELFAGLLRPALSTFAHPARQLAERICDAISTGRPPVREPLPMTFIARGSIGPRLTE